MERQAGSGSVVRGWRSVSKQRDNSIRTCGRVPPPLFFFRARCVLTRQDLEPLLRLCLQSVRRVGFQNFFLSRSPNRKSQMTGRRQARGKETGAHVRFWPSKFLNKVLNKVEFIGSQMSLPPLEKSAWLKIAGRVLQQLKILTVSYVGLISN